MSENNLSEKSCCFFGHRNTPQSVEPLLTETTKKLILEQNVRYFYVGNQGNFDSMVLSSLKKLKESYPQIEYTVVLAYMPSETTDKKYGNISLYPDGLEYVPKRFAVSHRNNWMIKHSYFLYAISDIILAVYYSLSCKASKPVSPVRTRTISSISLIKILPSPICPV